MSNTRVYFIKSAHSKAVKIGVADDPRARLAGLQTGSAARLELLAEMPGDERYERLLHAAFAEYRIHGEWFRLDGRLAVFVALLPTMPTDEKQPRRRQPRLEVSQEERDRRRAEGKRNWQELLAVVRDAVIAYGLNEFAELVDAKRHVVTSAIYENGPHDFKAEWFCILLQAVPKETSLKILRTLCEPLGYEILTPEQAVEREKAERELAYERAQVLVKFGPERGAQLLAQFDAEIAAERVRCQLEDFDKELGR